MIKPQAPPKRVHFFRSIRYFIFPGLFKHARERKGYRRIFNVRILSELVVAFLVVTSCTTLNRPPPVPDIYSLPPALSGTLCEVSQKFAAGAAPGHSGFLQLSLNEEAFKWRLALINHATSTIDVQYFIWQNDETGRLLFDHLFKAADRGVRVRMLVDDLTFAPTDRVIAAISRHPNFDIKIYNPGKVRESILGGIGEFLLYLKELNRRMHNKLFVVDNRLAIVGGRNIGNEYFGLNKKYNFRDLDVLVIGPVVEEISRAFDIYWNAKLSYPGSVMSEKATREDLKIIREENEKYLEKHRDVLVSYPLELRQWHKELLQLPSRLKTGEAHFLQDTPVSNEGKEYRLVDMLDYLAGPNHKELIIITPYLIPGRNFLENIEKLSSEGVKVKILTGSMGSNNHTVAHSHYKKYRRPILEAGAELYEFKHDPSATVRDIADVVPVESQFISLHIKALVGDRQRCFVGSLNLDPRALEINTENGLYIQSPGLCGELAEQFDDLMAPENVWRVTIDENDQLRWKSSTGVVTIQPARSFWQRIADFFFRLLPIESQL